MQHNKPISIDTLIYYCRLYNFFAKHDMHRHVENLTAVKKRAEKGVPYENEPLVQVFNQLITDRPGGGFWSYGDVKEQGMKILGFPPFSSTDDLKKKLSGSLAREIQTHDGLIVTCGHKQSGVRGIRIEQYRHPDGYQTSMRE